MRNPRDRLLDGAGLHMAMMMMGAPGDVMMTTATHYAAQAAGEIASDMAWINPSTSYLVDLGVTAGSVYMQTGSVASTLMVTIPHGILHYFSEKL